MIFYPNLAILLILAFITNASGQPGPLNTTALELGYAGKVAKVSTYEYVFFNIDTSINDSLVFDKDKLLEEKYFDELGNLSKIVRLNYNGKKFITYFDYNEALDLEKITVMDNHSETTMKELLVYDSAANVICKHIIPSFVWRTRQEKHWISKECFKFDDLHRIHEIAYVDTSNYLVRKTNVYYEGQTDRVLKSESFEYGILKEYFLNSYDTLGRKQSSNAFDSNGTLKSVSQYSWIDDNAFDFEQYHLGKLVFKSKEVSIRDKKNNVVKRYFYDLLDGATSIYTYDITYYVE